MPDIINDFANAYEDRERQRTQRTSDDSVSRSRRSSFSNTGIKDAAGYHPSHRPMYIRRDKKAQNDRNLGSFSGSRSLQAHYDPKEFTESYTMDYAMVPITGTEANPIQFKTASPRKWSMTLFFNDLGVNSKSRHSSAVSVDESLKILRSFALPSSYGGYDVGSAVGSTKPPVLIVYLISQAFRCHLTAMTVRRTKIHPLTRFTLRAEVDVEFTEFIESASTK